MTDEVRSLIAEFLGTFILVLVGTTVIVSTGGGSAPVLLIGLGFGLALMAGLYAFGGISGGHFNPAVSLAAMLDRRIDIATMIQYWIVQLAGAVAGSLAVLVAARTDGQELVAQTVTGFADGLTKTAFLTEVYVTAIFVMVILAATKKAGLTAGAIAGISLTLAASHFAALTISGASLNPARSFGPALIGNEWEGFWLYVVAPLVGAIAGWILHTLATTGKVEIPDVT
ncbi:MAG: MIP/aquaporin family protein [Acidimicrobiia bacterium]